LGGTTSVGVSRFARWAAEIPGSAVRRYAPLWPSLSWAVFAIGSAYCIAALLGMAHYTDPQADIMAVDAYVYWHEEPYSSEHYRYSPAFHWLSGPLRALPFEAFLAVWTIAHLAAVAWLGPWTILLAYEDVIRGNINTFMAVAVVLAVRGQAWTWGAALLTKVTPGVGIVYHAARREWGALGVAFGATVAVVVIGGLVDPELWLEWLSSLRAGTDNYPAQELLAPLPIRVAVGTLLCALAARWIWLLPVGMVIAMPALWPASFAVLAALPRLRRAREVRSSGGGAGTHR
jgi:hypothetical protein